MIRNALENEKSTIYRIWKEMFSFDDQGYTDYYFSELYRAKDTLVYVKDDKREVVYNGVTYNYGNSTNLMDDKLGGTLENNGGNIRYYGSNPNNYIYFNNDFKS